MPHVIIKMQSGRSKEVKQRIADAVTDAIRVAGKIPESSLSVAIEDVAAGDWTETVYKPDILGKPDTIFKKPGYDPF